jgi:hypothetical protein
MSCYFRHLKEIFAEAGVEVNADNRKDLDRAIHAILDVQYKDCPTTWKAIKAATASPEGRRRFIESLKTALPR